MTQQSASKFKLKLLHKGLLFALAILACELGFICMLAWQLNEVNQELELQLKSKQVMALANKVDLDYTEASIAVGVYGYTKWRPYRQRYDYWAPRLQQDLAELKRLLAEDKNDPTSQKVQPLLKEATDSIVRGIMILEDSIEAIERPSLDMGVGRAPVRLESLTRVREQIRNTLHELTGESRRIESTSKETRETQRRNLTLLLGVGVAFNVALALAFVFLFFFEITKRIGVIQENALLLAVDKPLNRPLGGGDEIAELDKVFHSMAAALKEAARKEQAVIEHMIVGLIVVGRNRRIRIANPAAIAMFDYKWEELEGLDVLSLFAESSAFVTDEQKEEFYSRLTGKAHHHVYSLEACKRNGEEFPVQMSMSDFAMGKENCYLINILDVSELRELERKRREFVATVTHELRTPLTSICASLTLLSTNESIDDKSREMLRITDRSTQRLIKLINDLLDVDKLESGQLFMEFDLVILSQVLKRSTEAVSALAAKHRIAIDARSELIHVVADEDRIVQVLVNLLSNAIKFSPEGEKVTVNCSVKDSNAYVEVIDKGRGIPHKYKDILFQRFQQVEHADAKQKGGSGLGLAICKAIIKQHGGTIGFDSVEGEGSTFWFTIPLADEDDDRQLSTDLGVQH